jgi:hypothetical protein
MPGVNNRLADIQDFGVGAQHDGDDGRVAGDPPDRLGCQQLTGQHGRPGTGPGPQVLQVDGDEQRGLGGDRSRATGGGGPPADFDQCVAAALVAGAHVWTHWRGLGCGQGSEDGLQDFFAFWVQA